LCNIDETYKREWEALQTIKQTVEIEEVKTFTRGGSAPKAVDK
jgi:hypothetical protein